MSSNYNKCIFVGRLARDHSVRASQGGNVVSNAIAVSGWKKEDPAMFLDVVAFKKSGEILERYTGKGSLVMLEGSLTLNKWEAKDGTKRQKHELIIDRVVLLPNKDAGERSAPEAAAHAEDEYGDAPF